MISYQKTPISKTWQIRIFGTDFVFGWIRIAKAEKLQYTNDFLDFPGDLSAVTSTRKDEEK